MTSKEFVKEFLKFHVQSYIKDEVMIKIAIDDLAQKAMLIKDEED